MKRNTCKRVGLIHLDFNSETSFAISISEAVANFLPSNNNAVIELLCH